MLRAAAKNHAYVTVIVDPADYARVLTALSENHGSLPHRLRQELAAKAFARTAAYDAAISTWFAGEIGVPDPAWRSLSGRLGQTMRYGENPHQSAALYLTGEVRPVPRPRGRCRERLCPTTTSTTRMPPSNSSASSIRRGRPRSPSSSTPTLRGRGSDDPGRGLRASACLRPGLGLRRHRGAQPPLDAAAAREITGIFTEVIIAPGASEEAIAIVAAKPNLRLLLTEGLADPVRRAFRRRPSPGDSWCSRATAGVVDDIDLKVVTKRAPDEREMADLRFAFRVAKHVKSNAIVYVREGATVGIGAGQMSRVDSSRIAARKALDAAEAAGASEPGTKGSVVASDAFFPFADGLLSAVEAGATAVIQPGGSMRDADVIAAADDHGIAMVFTGHASLPALIGTTPRVSARCRRRRSGSAPRQQHEADDEENDDRRDAQALGILRRHAHGFRCEPGRGKGDRERADEGRCSAGQGIEAEGFRHLSRRDLIDEQRARGSLDRSAGCSDQRSGDVEHDVRQTCQTCPNGNEEDLVSGGRDDEKAAGDQDEDRDGDDRLRPEALVGVTAGPGSERPVRFARIPKMPIWMIDQPRTPAA